VRSCTWYKVCHSITEDRSFSCDSNLKKKKKKFLNAREYRRCHQIWRIQRNWQHRVHKTKKKKTRNTICVGHHYVQTNTNNANKTLALLHKTGGNIGFVLKSLNLTDSIISYQCFLCPWIVHFCFPLQLSFMLFFLFFFIMYPTIVKAYDGDIFQRVFSANVENQGSITST
jgi:hypothetical protein